MKLFYFIAHHAVTFPFSKVFYEYPFRFFFLFLHCFFFVDDSDEKRCRACDWAGGRVSSCGVDLRGNLRCLL
jgi:hypothetical protein